MNIDLYIMLNFGIIVGIDLKDYIISAKEVIRLLMGNMARLTGSVKLLMLNIIFKKVWIINID